MPRMSLQPGTTLGPYEVIEPIGVGGMGEVYHARDTKLKRDVALKVLPRCSSTIRNAWRGSSVKRKCSRR